MKKIAIIGAGAAGLMASIVASKKGLKVHLFEHSDRVGKKILASGNGRCNISNKNLHVNDFAGEDPSFVNNSLKNFDFKMFEKFFFTLGLLLDIKDDGRAYPRSNESKAVTTVLKNSALKSGVTFFTDSYIQKVIKTDDTFNLYTREDNTQQYNGYAAVIIATGSEAAPQLGANGSGYNIAHSFGHTIIPTYPSLVQLHLDSNFHHKMAGVKQNAHVTLYINNKKADETEGDTLFTKYGISGFAILDISHKASHALLQYNSVTIGIDLFSDIERQKLIATINSICTSLKNYTILEVLTTLVPSKMAPHILKSSKIEENTDVSSLTPKQIKQVVNVLKNWRFDVIDTHGFKHAEVSGGGVSTSDVNSKTMESNKTSGLYFAGEVLDIVGRRGGYNLHFAWASGHIAATAIIKEHL
ncbi:MAG: NAD(P)/FAD-dependent oxidoreductase [Campylobacterota bacterium]|nr:NAD(P)/FAD-dependent oxidoreductase [Campylobacterota bacterium]